jgi:hypothetical protein
MNDFNISTSTQYLGNTCTKKLFAFYPKFKEHPILHAAARFMSQKAIGKKPSIL